MVRETQNRSAGRDRLFRAGADADSSASSTLEKPVLLRRQSDNGSAADLADVFPCSVRQRRLSSAGAVVAGAASSREWNCCFWRRRMKRRARWCQRRWRTGCG